MEDICVRLYLSHLCKLFPSLTDNRSAISFLQYQSSSYTLQILLQRPEERKKKKLSSRKKKNRSSTENLLFRAPGVSITVTGSWSCSPRLKTSGFLQHKIRKYLLNSISETLSFICCKTGTSEKSDVEGCVPQHPSLGLPGWVLVAIVQPCTCTETFLFHYGCQLTAIS